MYYCIDFEVINNKICIHHQRLVPFFSSFEMAQLLTAMFGTIPRQCSLQPYQAQNGSSRSITEAKQRRAQLVLGWVIAWEYWVLKNYNAFG